MKKRLLVCAMLFAGALIVNAQSIQVKPKRSSGSENNAKENFCTVFGTVIQQTNVTCYGGNNGNVVVFSLGGTQPYSYSWSPAVGNTFPLDTIDLAGGMTAGNYTCMITDNVGCTFSLHVTITQPPSFILSADTLLSFPCNSQAWVNVQGSVSSYLFSWTPSGGTSDTATGLCAGVYVVTITDSSGCVENDTINIINSAGVQQYAENLGINIFPVPAKDRINFSIKGNSFVPKTLSIFDLTGREIVSEKINANNNTYSLDVSNLSAGTYFLKLTGNGVKIVKFTVAEK